MEDENLTISEAASKYGYGYGCSLLNDAWDTTDEEDNDIDDKSPTINDGWSTSDEDGDEDQTVLGRKASAVAFGRNISTSTPLDK